jgi:hypothetical protein
MRFAGGNRKPNNPPLSAINIMASEVCLLGSIRNSSNHSESGHQGLYFRKSPVKVFFSSIFIVLRGLKILFNSSNIRTVY